MPTWDRERSKTAETAPHRTLHHLIWDLGFDVEDELPVGTYTLDCYVRELHLGFEADGPTHHTPKGRRHDQERDAWLHDAVGIPVMRFRSDYLAKVGNHAQVQDAILEFIEDFADSVSERKALARATLGVI